MHELGIAQSIVSQVRRAMAEHDLDTVTEVGLRIGVMAGVMNDALRFSYQAVTQDTPLAGSRLAITPDPIQVTCLDCGAGFEAETWTLSCTSCDATRLSVRGGNALHITHLETEEVTA